MQEPITFQRWMKCLRTALDLTQEMLAERAGCAVHTIRTFESGKRRPSRELAERLADVLQVPLEQRADFVRLARTAVRLEHPAEEVVGQVPPPTVPERAPVPAALPSGTVTLVFTDIEGSTKILQAVGERYAELLHAYRRIVRQTAAGQGGQVVDSQGDGCFVVFPHAVDAVQAALAIQRAMVAQAWPARVEVRARIGLHTGEPQQSEGGYVGLDVHRAARLAAAGHGGQLLLSWATANLIRDQLPPVVELRDLGEQRLKDLDRPEHVFQLVAPDLPADFPPLRNLVPAAQAPQPRAAALIATKLMRPPARPRMGLVARPRLHARLDAGRSGPLTLVTAPPGFGKTTLIADWLSQGTGNREQGTGDAANREPPTPNPYAVAWLALDAGDSDPVVFLRYLVAAVQTIDPAAGAQVLALLQAGQPPSIEALLPLLINDLVALPDPSILVLDDYHVVDSPAVHRALAFLLDHLPPRLHLVIASRADPPLPLARLRARGQLAELRAADLRFTPEEAAAFLREVMGLPLAAEEVVALEARTEGWIAGLQLAALAMRDRSDYASFIQAFAGSNRFVVDYLAEEVIERLPAHLHRFVLQTSILDRLCGPLCDAVVLGDVEVASLATASREQAYSQTVLEELERANLFIVPLDDERGWYRYHQLFAQVLCERLASGAVPGAVATLHRRASAWFEQQELIGEAVLHALAAQDWERAARLIEQHGQLLLTHGQQQTVLGWINSLPETVTRARPFLNVVYAGALFNMNQLEEAELRLRLAEQRLAPNTAEHQPRVVLGTVLLLRAYIALFCGDLMRWLTLSREALQILPDTETIARTTGKLDMASAFLLNGDVSPANEQCLAAAIAAVRDSGNTVTLVRGMVTLAAFQRRQGRLRQAATSYRASADIAPELLRVHAVLNGANYYFGLGELLLEWTDLDAAEGLLAQGREMVREKRLAEAGAVVLGYITLARLRQARGDGPGALAVLDELQAVLRERNFAPHLLARATAVRSRLALLQGDLAMAVKWADSSDLGVNDELTYLREPEYLTLARVRIVQGRHAPAGSHLGDALHLLGRLLETAEAGQRMDSVIEILTLRALALRAQGDRDGALTALNRALSLAAPEGYVRVFADEGAHMAALLHEARARGIAPGYVPKLLAAFVREDVQATPAAPPSPAPDRRSVPPGIKPLTEREMEVIRLLARGQSNQVIARELVVAVGTVKRHVNSVLGKLQVQSRLEAVARARELGLV